MDRMKRIMALSVSILAVALLASALSWEGSAMMGSYSDFPPGGYFAACNSFPRNTAVEVTNLETGKTVTVIIVRGLDNPGIFMMVSAEAAEALGLRQGKITRVRALEPRSVSSLAPSTGSRTAVDSDFNPRLLAAEELERMGYDIVETPAVAPAVASVEAEVGTVTVPAAAPEVVEPIAAVVSPQLILPLEEKPEAVQDLIKPEPALVETGSVPEPGPEAPTLAAEARPDAINGGKPKPVRTVVLPELPEPEVPSIAVLVPAPTETEKDTPESLAVPEPKPELFALTLPVPDETPIRVSPSPVPKRFEAPAALPDVLDRHRAPQLASEPLVLSLVEPQAPEPEGIIALPLETPPGRGIDTGLALMEPEVETEEGAAVTVRTYPSPGGVAGSIALAEPGAMPADRVVALELLTPPLRGGVPPTSLAWPELEADEIPDVVLARLTEPVQMVPLTSLAEGEVIFPATERPLAVALETPSFGAAETRLTLAVPELEALDDAEVLAPSAPGILASDLDIELAEADISSKAPVVTERSAPGEVVVILEPTDLRPPVLDAPVVAEHGPKTEAQAPVTQAPAVTTEVPVPATKPPVPSATVAPVSPAAVMRSAMVTGTLEKGKHYIQVGAYRTEAVAAETVSALRMDYVIVLDSPAGSSTRIWKIFVGPLGRDESGMALLRVRSLGFKDAFLKIGG